jgi:dihydrofolate reductase
MRKLLTTTFVTLDGVMQAPGGPEEDPVGGFDLGGWSVGYFDDTVGGWMGETMTPPFDLLLGRRTYEIFAAYWPTSTEDTSDLLNDATKYVASRTLERVDWRNSRLLEGDAAGAVRALKTGDGPQIQVHGSGDLIQTLLTNDLVDEMRVLVFPVVLGRGKRLFADGTVPAGLRLLNSSVSPSGVVRLVYTRDGAPKFGTFG